MTAFAVSVVLLWLPALGTPFWGDDYVFLQAAHAANAASAPWWSDLWPAVPPKFWRPLSQEGYWRVIDAFGHDSARIAHAASLLLHLLAGAGVALLAGAIGRACRWPQPGRVAVLAGVLYAGLALHLLPVHWAAAINSAFLVLFTTLCLASWVAAGGATRGTRMTLLASAPLWLALGLLSKESAALTPALMIVVRLFTGQRRMRAGEWLSLAACLALTLAWLVLDRHLAAHADASYALVIGPNMLRNAAAFAAWLSDVPREALRMLGTGDRVMACMWIAATAGPMLAACALAFGGERALLRRHQWIALVLFAGIAYGPYFLLAWNSYAYYAAIAAILPAIALARASAANPRIALILVLLAMSSWIAVEGTRRLDHPGLIGRARWAEAMLTRLEQRHVQAPLWVAVKDDHRFYAVGVAGLAWRLHLSPKSIHVAPTCPVTATQCLRIDDDGRWQLEPMRQ